MRPVGIAKRCANTVVLFKLLEYFFIERTLINFLTLNVI